MSRFANTKALEPPVQAVSARPSVQVVSSPLPIFSPAFSADRLSDPDRENMIRRLGVWLLLAFGFVRFSFLTDIVANIIASRSFIVMGLGVPTMVLMLISGGLRRTFRARPAYFMVGLMFWLVLAAPFSFWKGGSVALLLQSFETEFSMLFLIAGLLLSLREVNRFLSVLAISGAFLGLASLYYGTQQLDRFGFSFGTLQNANDYATHLLLLLPFLVLVVLNSSSYFLRFSAVLFAFLNVYFVLKTGSRGGLLALIAMLGFFFLKAKTAQRVGIAVSLVILVAAMIFALPRATLQRYMLLVDSSVDQEADSDMRLESAVTSAEQRKAMLTDSLTLTMHHPLLGVGPGMFAASDAEQAKEQGRRGAWLLTHNTYTEISSESGIPGFLLFVGTLLSTYLLLSSVYVRAKKDPRFVAIRNTAFCMMLSILGFSVCIFFAAMSYRYYLPSMAGLSIAFAVAAKREMESKSPALLVPARPSWAPRTAQ